MISKEDVRHIAKLARIKLSASEEAQFQKELGAVLEYFEKLANVDAAHDKAFGGAMPLENRTRKDQAKPKRVKEGRFLLAMAPDTQDGYVKVKSIL